MCLTGERTPGGIFMQKDQTNATDPTSYVDSMFHGAPAALTRREIEKRTGGAISVKTLANLDAQEGKGIPGKFRFGVKTCYPLDSTKEWLKARIESIPSKEVC
jgi:hypothetical protein